MKRITIILSALIISTLMFGQNTEAQYKFENVKHDFGKFKEEAGHQTAVFEFTNTGAKDMLVTRVVASCGCTTPEWTKTPVKPGEKGFVKVTYDPRNRPNKFKKTAAVYSNANPKVAVLTIEGDVIPRVLTTEEIYRWPVADQVRFKSNHLAFTNVIKGQKRIKVMELINVSDHDIKVGFDNIHAYLNLKVKPEVIKKGEKGIVEGVYDSKLNDDWGYVNGLVKVKLNDVLVENVYFVVSANLVEDFGSMSKAELAAAPVATFESTNFNFGTIKQSEKANVSFKFKNTGKSDLILRNIRSTCGCTTVTPSNTVIKAGESSSIDAVFDAGARKGKQHKVITLITNDPKHSQVNLVITGEVLDPAGK